MFFCTTTLGCKANQYDTETIEKAMLSNGHVLKKAGDGCDVCIINTCAVTAESVRKSRQAIRRVRKKEPEALIAVCGCYPVIEKDESIKLNVDIIGGTDNKEAFISEIELLHSSLQTPHSKLIAPNSSIPTPNSSRTRALLKIQDGCDNHCAYCIIPQARGRSRSATLSEIEKEAKNLHAQGYKEIVITGIEISSYKPSLIKALHAISKNAPNARLRLGSLNPEILTDEFIDEIKNIPGICNHFHISLQSGCDITLMHMKRKYTTQQVYKSIQKLRREFDNCAITADLITGFPGETDEHFEQTLRFIEKAAFSAMHIFPFSPRPQTKAAAFTDQIPVVIRQARARAATEIAAKMNESFKQSQIGKTLEVLIEKNNTGHSSNYQTVTTSGKVQRNTMVNVMIEKIKDGNLHGKFI